MHRQPHKHSAARSAGPLDPTLIALSTTGQGKLLSRLNSAPSSCLPFPQTHIHCSSLMHADRTLMHAALPAAASPLSRSQSAGPRDSESIPVSATGQGKAAEQAGLCTLCFPPPPQPPDTHIHPLYLPDASIQACWGNTPEHFADADLGPQTLYAYQSAPLDRGKLERRLDSGARPPCWERLRLGPFLTWALGCMSRVVPAQDRVISSVRGASLVKALEVGVERRLHRRGFL